MTAGIDQLLTVDEFEEAARAALPRLAWDYYRSGADSEDTLRKNRAAFAHWELWYRVLVDVSARDLRISLFGSDIAFPILIAPTAYHQLAHPDGESETARAAAALDTLYVVSTLATVRLEDVAAAAPEGKRWFQLYVHKDRGLTRSLVERAVASGYRALVVTVDTPLLGRRIADERNGFCLPDGMIMANLMAPGESPPDARGGSSLAAWFAARYDTTLGWRDIEWLRELTSLPILLKGIVRGDDAARALDCGIQGIIVSNHGGRQLDGAPATIDALPEVVAAVDNKIPVLMDGGVRWGADILKALALGARAVLVGRPVLWGLAAGGGPGVTRILTLLRDELSRAMALAGCARASAVDRDLVRRAAR